ncbi:MAG: hypothetical protein ACRDF7_06125 [Candidatus Limnocylindrales bacterium]
MAASLAHDGGGRRRPGDGPRLVHLRLSHEARIDRRIARRRLDGPGWLGAEVDGGPPGLRRFETDLVLPLRSGRPRTVFRKAAYVDIGPVSVIERGLSVDIGWRSATLAPLFPVFAGRLDVGSAGLLLEGWYGPPGGEAGLILDRAFLGIAARGTARWFLERVALALTNEGTSATEAPQPR